jgi:hypothetical protein
MFLRNLVGGLDSPPPSFMQCAQELLSLSDRAKGRSHPEQRQKSLRQIVRHCSGSRSARTLAPNLDGTANLFEMA